MICPNCGSPMVEAKDFRSFYHWEDECTYYKLIDISKCNRCGITNEDGKWVIPESLKPTQKQERTVVFIESRLDVYYDPEVKLRRNCSEFIAKYFEKAKNEPIYSQLTEEDCDYIGLDESMFY